MSVIVDTGVLLAAADADDADHERCARLLRRYRGQLRVPAPVVPECSWQVEHDLGAMAEARFLRLITTGELTVLDLTVADYARCIDLIETYADLGLGLVDASVITVAENLGPEDGGDPQPAGFRRGPPPPHRRPRTHPLTPARNKPPAAAASGEAQGPDVIVQYADVAAGRCAAEWSFAVVGFDGAVRVALE